MKEWGKVEDWGMETILKRERETNIKCINESREAKRKKSKQKYTQNYT